MGKKAVNYGSDFQLSVYLTNARAVLDRAVLDAIGLTGTIQWLNQPLSKKQPVEPVQWKGIRFVSDEKVQQAWRAFWPQRAGIHNWDAVGWIKADQARHLLLVEAKANLGELRSSCKATRPASVATIKHTLDSVKQDLDVAPHRDWLQDTISTQTGWPLYTFFMNKG